MKKIMRLFIMLGTVLMLGSCVNDKPYNPTCDRYLNVRSFDGNDSQISDVAIYVYDINGVLLDFYRNVVNNPINFEKYRLKGVLNVVVWGNALGNPIPQTLSEPILGSQKSEHKLVQNFSEEIFMGTKLTQQPSDLFYGATMVNFSSDKFPSNSIETIYIKRAVSSYILTVRNLEKQFNIPNGNYKVVVRHPNNGFDFGANVIAQKSIYHLPTIYNSNTDELTSSIAIALPTVSRSMTIEIYSSDKLLYTAIHDKENNPISLIPNKLHNILIDFEGETGVEFVVSGWGDVVIFQGF